MLHIPSQITRRTPLRRRMAAMEQAANPMNRKTAPKAMSVSWPRSVARSWSSKRAHLPNIATIPDSMSTLMGVWKFGFPVTSPVRGRQASGYFVTRLKIQNRMPARTAAAGKVKTHAKAIFLRVATCRPLPLAAMGEVATHASKVRWRIVPPSQ